MEKDKVIAVCEKHWEANKRNCSGFVNKVAAELGVALEGQANDMVDAIAKLPWKTLASGVEARTQAELGFLVVGGLKATGHGHVVVVVKGPLAKEKYPTAYWGQLGGEGRKATTVNWSWNKADRDKVVYAYYSEKV